jgi:hypothetical protein
MSKSNFDCTKLLVIKPFCYSNLSLFYAPPEVEKKKPSYNITWSPVSNSGMLNGQPSQSLSPSEYLDPLDRRAGIMSFTHAPIMLLTECPAQYWVSMLP